MSYKAVIHLPKEQKNEEKLMHEIALFRAEKTLKILCEWSVTPEQLAEILRDLRTSEQNKQGK